MCQYISVFCFLLFLLKFDYVCVCILCVFCSKQLLNDVAVVWKGLHFCVFLFLWFNAFFHECAKTKNSLLDCIVQGLLGLKLCILGLPLRQVRSGFLCPRHSKNGGGALSVTPVRACVIKIWCPLNNFWKTASIPFIFGMLIYNIKTQVEFDLGYNPLIFDGVMGLL